MVVDDTEWSRMILRKELESGGYHVIEASSGLEALHIIKQTSFSDLPDLITLDIEMPFLNGFDTCKKLYSKQYTSLFNTKNQPAYRVPIIFITGK